MAETPRLTLDWTSPTGLMGAARWGTSATVAGSMMGAPWLALSAADRDRFTGIALAYWYGVPWKDIEVTLSDGSKAVVPAGPWILHRTLELATSRESYLDGHSDLDPGALLAFVELTRWVWESDAKPLTPERAEGGRRESLVLGAAGFAASVQTGSRAVLNHLPLQVVNWMLSSGYLEPARSGPVVAPVALGGETPAAAAPVVAPSQPPLTAGFGIDISEDDVISATLSTLFYADRFGLIQLRTNPPIRVIAKDVGGEFFAHLDLDVAAVGLAVQTPAFVSAVRAPQLIEFSALDADTVGNIENGEIGFRVGGSFVQSNGTLDATTWIDLPLAAAVHGQDASSPTVSLSAVDVRAFVEDLSDRGGGVYAEFIQRGSNHISSVYAEVVEEPSAGRFRLSQLHWGNPQSDIGSSGQSWNVRLWRSGRVTARSVVGGDSQWVRSDGSNVADAVRSAVQGINESITTTGTYTRKTSATAAGHIQFDTNSVCFIYAHAGDVSDFDRLAHVNTWLEWAGVQLKPTSNFVKSHFNQQVIYTFNYTIRKGALPAVDVTPSAVTLDGADVHRGELAEVAFTGELDVVPEASSTTDQDTYYTVGSGYVDDDYLAIEVDAHINGEDTNVELYSVTRRFGNIPTGDSWVPVRGGSNGRRVSVSRSGTTLRVRRDSTARIDRVAVYRVGKATS